MPTDRAHFARLARYNQWANQRLYAACARLPEAEYLKPRPAFFKSLHGTLSHILVGDRLGGVVDAYRIGRSSYTKTVQNVSLAFTFNGIGVPAAMTGLVHPIWAMIAMVASVTTVLLNSFAGRLLPQRAPRKKEIVMEKITLRVPTIHCEGCVNGIRQTLGKLSGVQTVEGDPKEKRITATLQDGDIGRAEICKAIAEIGHVCGEQ